MTESADLAELPGVTLEVVSAEDPCQPGFLELTRHKLIAHYPDGSASDPFLYDSVQRRALDASVIVAHYRDEDGQAHVYLRSAVRPPVGLRPGSSYATSPELWELPAGLIEAAEAGPEGPRRCAAREAQEELGFALPEARFRELGRSCYPAPAVIGELHFFFEVEVDPKQRQPPSLDGSALEHCGRVIALPLAVALDWCDAGRIRDSKSELGLLRLEKRLSA